MNREFLRLKPTKYLCPYCGQWHDWEELHSLGCYTRGFFAELACQEKLTYRVESGCKCPDMTIYRPYKIDFNHDYCHVLIEYSMCLRGRFPVDREVSLKHFKYDEEQPRITFPLRFRLIRDRDPFIPYPLKEYFLTQLQWKDEQINCNDCLLKNNCNSMRLAKEIDNSESTSALTIELGFEFEKADYDRIIMPALLEQIPDDDAIEEDPE